jgi:hypothetical protein
VQFIYRKGVMDSTAPQIEPQGQSSLLAIPSLPLIAIVAG